MRFSALQCTLKRVRPGNPYGRGRVKSTRTGGVDSKQVPRHSTSPRSGAQRGFQRKAVGVRRESCVPQVSAAGCLGKPCDHRKDMLFDTLEGGCPRPPAMSPPASPKHSTLGQRNIQHAICNVHHERGRWQGTRGARCAPSATRQLARSVGVPARTTTAGSLNGLDCDSQPPYTHTHACTQCFSRALNTSADVRLCWPVEVVPAEPAPAF